MRKPMRFLVCASAAALILSAAPIGVFIIPAQAQVGVSITAGVAPPLLPVYAQPPIPGPGYLWIPGYWAWNGYEYYWAPGYWALPPAADLYWTPPYWAWNDGQYVFYAGYWGPTVGFYGGVDYGFGYTGTGYQGGFWRNDAFVYNRAVNNFGAAKIVNAYSRPVASPASRVAFSGGHGGTMAKPTPAQITARTHATPPTAEQVRHQDLASRDPALRFNANHGQPHIAAMQRANEFHGAHAVAATNAPAERPQAATHAAAAHVAAARPEVAEHAAARAHVAEHATAARQRFAYHAPAKHAFVAPRHFAYRAPVRHTFVAPRHLAYHAPAMRAPARQHFAYHAPAMRMGGMRMRGAPRFGGMRVGSVPHGGGPHGGGGGRHIP